MADERYNPLSMENYTLHIQWLKLYQSCWDSYLRTLLTIHGFTVAAIAVLFTKGDKIVNLPIAVLSILGIVTCFFGYNLLKRNAISIKLRYYQLRQFENFDDNSTDALKIFTYGYCFFHPNQDEYPKIDPAEHKKITGEEKDSFKIGQNEFACGMNFALGIVYVCFFVATCPKIYAFFKQLYNVICCC